MIFSWIENLILLAAGLLGWSVCEGLITHQAVPVCAPRGKLPLTAGPPGEEGGGPVIARRILWRAVRR